MKTIAEATSLEYIQEEDVRCMTHSSSTPDLTTRSFRKYCSVMRSLRIMESYRFFQMPIKDLRSNLVTKWNYLQQHTSNIKNLTKTEAKDQTRISRRRHLDRSNLHPIRRGISQWDSQEFQTSKMQLSKRLLNRWVVSKPVTTIQIREDHLQVLSILQLQALIKCLDHNPTKGPSSIKTPRVSKTNHLRSQPYLSNSLQAINNSRRRSSLLEMTFW